MNEPFLSHRNIDSVGRIVISQDLRQALGLSAGDGVTLRITEEGLLLTAAKTE